MVSSRSLRKTASHKSSKSTAPPGMTVLIWNTDRNSSLETYKCRRGNSVLRGEVWPKSSFSCSQLFALCQTVTKAIINMFRGVTFLRAFLLHKSLGLPFPHIFCCAVSHCAWIRKPFLKTGMILWPKYSPRRPEVHPLIPTLLPLSRHHATVARFKTSLSLSADLCSSDSGCRGRRAEHN